MVVLYPFLYVFISCLNKTKTPYIIDEVSKNILKATNEGYGAILDIALQNYDNRHIQKLGKITFNSDDARMSKNGVLIFKDINTGKDYGVVRNKDGSYDFYKGKGKKS